MALLDILHYPDPRLQTRAKPIRQVDARLRQLAADMAETMYQAPGVGLAATQINVHERLIVIDVSETKNELLVGCLSVPGFYDNVERPASVRVRALNLDGQSFELEADGLLAVCIQHEIDHLDGKVFVDYLSALKRNRIKSKLQKTARELARERSGTAA